MKVGTLLKEEITDSVFLVTKVGAEKDSRNQISCDLYFLFSHRTPKFYPDNSLFVNCKVNVDDEGPFVQYL